jgi:hypothetical protein
MSPGADEGLRSGLLYAIVKVQSFVLVYYRITVLLSQEGAQRNNAKVAADAEGDITIRLRSNAYHRKFFESFLIVV